MPIEFEYAIAFRRNRFGLILGAIAVAAVVGWPSVAWARMAAESDGWRRATLIAGVGVCVLIVTGVTASALWQSLAILEFRITLDSERLRVGAEVRTRWPRFDIAVSDIGRLVCTWYPLDGGETSYAIHLRDGRVQPIDMPFGHEDVCEKLFDAIRRLRADLSIERRSGNRSGPDTTASGH